MKKHWSQREWRFTLSDIFIFYIERFWLAWIIKKEWHFGRIMNLRYCIDRVVIISAKHLSRLFIDPAWCSIEGYSSPENPQGLTRASNLTFLWLIQWDQFEERFLSKLTEQVTNYLGKYSKNSVLRYFFLKSDIPQDKMYISQKWLRS